MIELPRIGPPITDAYVRNRLSQYATNKGAVIIKLWHTVGEDISDARSGYNHPLAPHWHAYIEYQNGTKEKLFFNKHRKVPHGTPRGWQRDARRHK